MTPKRARNRAAAPPQFPHLLATYSQSQEKLSIFLDSLRAVLLGSSKLGQYTHSIKWRLKDPEHLRDSLSRKAARAAEHGEPFDITPENMLVKVTDLVGFRVLHLHTRQMEHINPIITELLAESMMEIVEGPTARTWDDESRQFFSSLGIASIADDSLYTSVHYVVGSRSLTPLTAEIQVRTLAEELWGEVNHAINYPSPSSLLSCREQIKVLARVTSSCTRLVDSIFRAHEEGLGA